jgi:intracellular multiplication protein IcmL
VADRSNDPTKKLQAALRDSQEKRSKEESRAQSEADHSDDLDALGTVVTRNAFYRDGYRRLVKIALVEAVAIVVLIIGLVLSLQMYTPQDRFFATTADGRLIPMVALDQPNLNRAALLSWATQAATETMTFSFHNYEKSLQDASRHFTRRGWKSFTEAMENSRILETVQSRQQIVTAAPGAAPVLINEGVFGGVYTWEIEFPLLATFQSGNDTRTRRFNLNLRIVRVSTLESPNGVGIEQWVGA